MKNKTTFFIIIFAFSVSALFFNSCAPAYTPNVINAPLLNNKNEFQADLAAGISGTDLQLAYAAGKHIGFMVNGSYRDNTSDTTTNYHKHSFIEAGIGYYTTFSKDGHFELFGGYGYGDADVRANTILNTVNTTKATYHRVFVQPDIGFSSEFFDIAFSPRFVVINMHPEELEYTTITSAFIEPAGTIRFGYKFLYLTSQAGLSLPITKISSESWFEYQPFIFSLGIKIKIGKIYDETARY